MNISAYSNNSSISDQITYKIKEIEQVLTDLKKQDAKNTTKELESELIEYILAQIALETQSDNASGSSQVNEIGDQINKTIQTYTTDIQKADGLASQVKAIETNPQKQTINTLNSLDSLLEELESDLKTGNMSNLPNNLSF